MIKGRFYVKKIYSSVAAAAVLLGVMSVKVFAASSPSVTVKSDSGNVSYTYTSGDTNEVVQSADKLFANISDVSPTKTETENIKITSMAKGGDSVELSLRLELDDKSKSYPVSPLDYYSFLITDGGGNVVYDSAQAEKTDAAAKTKDIPLGTFNAYFTNDVKSYTVAYTADKTVYDAVSKADVKNIKLYVVSRVADKEQTPAPIVAEATPSAAPAATLKPKFDLGEETTETAAPTESPKPEETKAPEEQKAEGKKVVKECGKDIDPGRYTVKGNGIVTITDSKGEQKLKKTVTDGKIEVEDGVKQFVATLEKGDVITVVPLEGAEKASVSFEKTNTANTAAASTTNKKTAPASKANPKTGGGTGMGLVAAGFGISALAIAVLAAVRRKKNNA